MAFILDPTIVGRELHRRLNPEAIRDEVFGALGYEPHEKQREFHDADEWDVMYGGAAGGGKTLALLMDGILACIRYPGIKVMAIRESFQRLDESFLDELRKIRYASAVGAVYNQTNHDLNFANGSKIRFRYCDGLADATVRLGTEIQLLLVDEATRQDPAAIDFLCVRLRSSDPAIPVLGVRLGTNPSGPGHVWAKERYVDETEHGRWVYEDIVGDKPTGHWIRFIPARYTDNPHVPDYENTLDAVRDPQLRASMRDGSWDVLDGQVFAEWSRDRHVLQPFQLPASWPRYAGIDYGYKRPFAVVWGAVDNDGRAWIYRERYEAEVTEEEQARRILADEAVDIGSPVSLRAADPSMWGKHGAAQPPAIVYMTNGVALKPATNDRIPGWHRIHSYLADAPACAHHRAVGWKTCPMIHVFESCPNLIATLPALVYRTKGDVEDAQKSTTDHLPDALRYLVMELPNPDAGTLDAMSHRAPMTTMVLEDTPKVPSSRQWDDDDGPRRADTVATMNF